MKRAAAAATTFLALGTTVASAAGPVPAEPLGTGKAATISVSPAAPGANAAVRLAVRHAFYCGRPRRAAIALTFPAAEHVPSSIPESAVRLSAGTMKNVSVSGRTISISVAPPPTRGKGCMSIVVGKLKIRLGVGAHLANPGTAGTYAVAVRDGKAHYTARFKVSS